MEEEVANLRRQLAAARRSSREEHRRRVEAESRLRLNTLFSFLERCHTSLSIPIQVETDARPTTQGATTTPTNRVYPSQVKAWTDFPALQEQIWEKLEKCCDFQYRRLFPSDAQLEYVATNVQGRPIYSEASLRIFEHETVDTMVSKMIDAISQDTILRDVFAIRGRVVSFDRTPASLDDTSRESSGRRRNRRADQLCTHLIDHERRVPLYAVEFKAPHKLTVAELITGCHDMNVKDEIIGKEGDSNDFLCSRLVAAVITQVFSYMIDIGIRYGCVRTGEAIVFLHITEDPSTVLYYLCVPNQDVQDGDKSRLHRTAISQILAFTLQAIEAKAPTQDWVDRSRYLDTWELEYTDVLREIPETIRKEPPPSNYRPSHWKPPVPKIHNTRSRAQCEPDASTPIGSSDESTNDDMPSPTTAAAKRNQERRKMSQRPRGQGRQHQPHDQQETCDADVDFCTMACIRGVLSLGPLDPRCPNSQSHGAQSHALSSQEFIERLHQQLVRNRDDGFQQLHIRGRTGFLLKATLQSHGYTILIKGTTQEHEQRLQEEVATYSNLQALQGHVIPVCLGDFKPSVPYWYHGRMLARMMVLSWSGVRVTRIINKDNLGLLNQQRRQLLQTLQSYGVQHNDAAWRNMLWNEQSQSLVAIDFEDTKPYAPPVADCQGSIPDQAIKRN